MNDFDKITPLQRALLESVSIPDLAVGGLPQIKLLQSNSQDLLDSPEIATLGTCEGAMAGGFAGPESRRARLHARPARLPLWRLRLRPGVRIEGETRRRKESSNRSANRTPSNRSTRSGARIPSPARRSSSASNGHLMREHINCLMKVEETGQIGRYVFAKTALRIGREFANASQRLKVEGLDNVRGCVLGRYRWTSRLEKQDTRRWFLPVQTLAGKLGQPGGPSFETVLELAELRKTFMAGLPPALEIEGPPEPPALPSIDEPLDGPPEPPPYERNRDDRRHRLRPLRKPHPPTALGIADQTNF